MGDTSDHWTSFPHLDRDSVHGQKIEHVLQKADFPFLCSTAVQIRQALDAGRSGMSLTPAKSLRCSVDCGRFASGHDNIVLELQFSDSERWVARIRLPDESSEPDGIETSMLSEIATVRLVSTKTEIPVPQIYGFDVAAANPFEFRYLLMEALPGHAPDAILSRSVPEHQRDKVADQLAEYYYQLSRLRFDRIGRLWAGRQLHREASIVPAHEMGSFHTSLEYFYALRRSQTRAIRADHAGNEQWATAAWILEQALPSMVVEDHVYGPFPLCHVDLHHKNILFDKDFNITGIIDWSGAQTVPLERFLASPEFATFPGLSTEENTPTITFRDKFAAALRVRELTTPRSVGGGGSGGGGGWSEHDMTPSPALISDLIGTPLWEIVYRCTYSFHWRAMSDSRLVLRQIFGDAAKWEYFVAFHTDGPVHRTKF
jgi:isoamyl acetate esterase